MGASRLISLPGFCRLQKMETQHIREPARPPMELLDLHMSILAHVVSSLTEAKALSALGMTCRTMSELTSTYDWKQLCLVHWGITQSNPRAVRCMDSTLISGYAKIDKHGDASVIWEQRMRGNPWRNIYRDRTYGMHDTSCMCPMDNLDPDSIRGGRAGGMTHLCGLQAGASSFACSDGCACTTIQ